jgi:hypothetical protein
MFVDLRWVGSVAHMGKIRNWCRLLGGKPEVNVALEEPAHRWEGNINVDFKLQEGGLLV